MGTIYKLFSLGVYKLYLTSEIKTITPSNTWQYYSKNKRIKNVNRSKVCTLYRSDKMLIFIGTYVYF